jgi:predicted nucleotidyltransferase
MRQSLCSKDFEDVVQFMLKWVVSDFFMSIKWTDHNENLTHKKDSNTSKSNLIHKEVDEHHLYFHLMLYFWTRRRKTIHEFDLKRKVRIARHTKIRNIVFDIDTWFVKSLLFHFFCIENCVSETSFMTFSSKRSYSLMIEFDERENDDLTRWFFFEVWTTY